MHEVEWENCRIDELDLTSTELSEETLRYVLTRLGRITYLGLGHCEFFTDRVRHLLTFTVILTQYILLVV